MRLGFLASALACLSIAGSAQARHLESGLQLGFSQPTAEAGNWFKRGLNAGFTATIMDSPTGGVGVDLGYHRWPAASSREAIAGGFKIGYNPITRLTSAIQATIHGKAVFPTSGSFATWIQGGAGYYFVKTTVVAFNIPISTGELEFGLMGGIGFDRQIGADTKGGLDVTYHYLLWEDPSGTRFTALTIGAHVLFGGP